MREKELPNGKYNSLLDCLSQRWMLKWSEQAVVCEGHLQLIKSLFIITKELLWEFSLVSRFPPDFRPSAHQVLMKWLIWTGPNVLEAAKACEWLKWQGSECVSRQMTNPKNACWWLTHSKMSLPCEERSKCRLEEVDLKIHSTLYCSRGGVMRLWKECVL